MTLQIEKGVPVEFVPFKDEPQDLSIAVKQDENKAPLDLLPFEALIEVAKVLQFGAKKYDRHNWRKGFKWSRLLAANLRHLFAWARREDLDPESGISHLAHACCMNLFLLAHELQQLGEDDRWKKSK
jgi:Domain of unknown function (DUF5664)